MEFLFHSFPGYPAPSPAHSRALLPGWDTHVPTERLGWRPLNLGEVLSRHLLCALQARPCGLLKQTALNKIPGRFQLHQEALPHLPVPPLQQTLDRYLLALQPIVSPEELSHTQGLVEEFRKPGGVGERLQKGLERRARKTENWVGQSFDSSSG